MADNDLPDLITIEEAASKFGLGRTSLFRYLREGKLTRYRAVGSRQTLVSQRELRELVKPRPEPPDAS